MQSRCCCVRQARQIRDTDPCGDTHFAAHAMQWPALRPLQPLRYVPGPHEPQLAHEPALRPEQPVLYLPALQLGHVVQVPEELPPQPALYLPSPQLVGQELHGPAPAKLLYFLLNRECERWGVRGTRMHGFAC